MRQRSAEHGVADRLGDTHGSQLPQPQEQPTRKELTAITGASGTNRLGITNSPRPQPGDQTTETDGHGGAVVAAGPWSDSRPILCRDGKTRSIPRPESSILPLAYGVPRRMGPLVARLELLGVDPSDAKRIIRLARSSLRGRLRGYGNAIVPIVAAEFIRAYLDTSKPPH